MTLLPFIRTTTLLLLCALFDCRPASAQVFDFGQLDAFESLGSGTQRGGAPPKTIVEDNDRHTVLFTIIESDTDARIYWKSEAGTQTTLMSGPGLRAFQTVGEFRIEALGDENRSVKYGYVLLRLKNQPKNSKGT
ncbi:MAG TPA: hypothetical protein VEH02_11365 [Pseudolabrys sp.]|nr:hypothetical protein [Pseudolabrys sp.]